MGNDEGVLLHTPLYDLLVKAGGRMVPFGGWEMPVQFDGLNIEHQAVREQVGLFDISHMGQFSLVGEGGAGFLDHLLPARISELAIGRMLYSTLCNEEGGCIDDVVVYRLAEVEYLLVVNASRIENDWHWVNDRAEGVLHLQIENLSNQQGMIAVQGPQSEAMITALVGTEAADLGYYGCMRAEIAGIESVLSRNGYTGEDGFEIICAADQVAALWQSFCDAGVRPCGLGARDILRLEMGFCLYGHELTEQITPLEAGLAWTMNLQKEAEFVGAAALREMHEVGGYRKLRGFRMLERGIPRSDYPILDERGGRVGTVTSGTYSPCLAQGIGLAYLGDGVQAKGSTIFVEMRGKRIPAEVVILPFVRSAVKKPPNRGLNK